MLQTKSILWGKINSNPYLFINLVFAFFPISFILGSLIVNVNLLLFCCLGIFYLKSKILKTKFDFSIKIIFLFFVLIFFSTSLSFVKSLYFEEYDSSHLFRLMKSVLFFRFFLLLIIIYLLNKFDILNFRYFFLTAALASLLLSLDVIYQYIFGFDMIGLKGQGPRNSGFFGDEYIAGGYIQRFSLFAILFTILVFKNKNYTKFIFTITVICILIAGIFLTGNRMPLVLFLFGLFLIPFFNIKIKKILLVSLVTIFILLQLLISSNDSLKIYVENAYHSFGQSVQSILHIMPPETMKWRWTGRGKIPMKLSDVDDRGGDEPRSKTYFFEVKYETPHLRILLTSIETWKFNKLFGNGIKSFRVDCWKLEGRPDVYLGDDLMPGKRNLLCSNHPHNYYFEILTETGIAGIFIISIMALSFVVFLFKNFKFIKQINIENFILLSAIISLVLETLPLRSTGSLFTTNNATYLILISSIVLSYKTLLKIKNFQ